MVGYGSAVFLKFSYPFNFNITIIFILSLPGKSNDIIILLKFHSSEFCHNCSYILILF